MQNIDIQELIQHWDAAEKSILEMEALLGTMNPREGIPEELHEDLTSMVGRIKKTLDDYKSVYDGLLEFI